MAGIELSQFNKVLDVVRRSSSDSERFASLLVVSKLISAHSLNSEQRKELFNSIGLSFPIRLLITSANEEFVENKSTYASIGANTLMSLCSDDEIMERTEVVGAIPHLKKLIDQFSKNKEEIAIKVLADCLDCMLVLVRNKHCLNKMLECDVIKALCHIDETEKSLTLLISILTNQNNLWEIEFEVLNGFMDRKCSTFKNEQSELKFRICNDLFSVLSTVPNFHPRDCACKWQKNLLDGLKDIVCSRVKAKHRKNALLLAAEMSRIFGFKVFFTEPSDNFPFVLCRLACIEAGLFLLEIEHSGDDTGTKNDLAAMLACCSLMEQFCSSIADFEQNEDGSGDLLTFEQIKMAQNALSDFINSVSTFLNDNLPSEMSPATKLCFHAIVRVLGSWLNIEYNVNSSQGKELLPILVEILKHTLKNRELFLLKFTLPAIMISFENNETKTVILKHDIVSILKDLLQFVLEDLNCPNDMEANQALHFVVQCIIGVSSVLSSEKSSQQKETLGKLFEIISETLSSKQHLTLESQMYLYTARLVTLDRIDSCKNDDKIKDTMRDSLQFFCDAFTIDKFGQLHKTEGFIQIWDSISELWMIGMKEITKLVKSAKSTKDIQDSELFSHLLRLRDEVHRMEDEEIYASFHELLESIKE